MIRNRSPETDSGFAVHRVRIAVRWGTASPFNPTFRRAWPLRCLKVVRWSGECRRSAFSAWRGLLLEKHGAEQAQQLELESARGQRQATSWVAVPPKSQPPFKHRVFADPGFPGTVPAIHTQDLVQNNSVLGRENVIARAKKIEKGKQNPCESALLARETPRAANHHPRRRRCRTRWWTCSSSCSWRSRCRRRSGAARKSAAAWPSTAPSARPVQSKVHVPLFAARTL